MSDPYEYERGLYSSDDLDRLDAITARLAEIEAETVLLNAAAEAIHAKYADPVEPPPTDPPPDPPLAA